MLAKKQKFYNTMELNPHLVRISNTGHPISDKNMKKLFDPFFTTKQPNKEPGLVLYISYNLIRKHMGFKEVSNSKTRTSFDIYLPISHSITL